MSGLPNPHLAVVLPEKLHGYLLCDRHPVGQSKAVFFRSLGFTKNNWEALLTQLLQLAWRGPAVRGQPSPYGDKYQIRGTLVGPNGRSATITTIWLIRIPEGGAHFITAFPS